MRTAIAIFMLAAPVMAHGQGTEPVMILEHNESGAPWTGEYTFTVPAFSIEH